MIVEILNVGTELLMGNIVNTNSAYLAQQCTKEGHSVYYMTTVGDNEKRLCEAIKTGVSRSQILIISGGLGPTMDDITKECVAKVCGLELVEDVNVKEEIRQYFEMRGKFNIPNNNWKQALVPTGAIILPNRNGTAPALFLTYKNCHIFLLPGPPNELKPLFEQEVVPYLRQWQEGIFVTSMIKLSGVGESFVEHQMSDLIKNQTNPTIAPYAKEGEVHLRVTARGKEVESANKLLAPVVNKIVFQFEADVYTTKEEVTLEESVISLLKEHHLKISTVESCTGGLIAGRLINVSGASDVLDQGFVTYANEAKEQLVGVQKDTIIKCGAVSEETAKEMAYGVATRYKSDVGLSVTGIAGPTGGTKEKPVGLVYIGCYLKGKTFVKECRFSGNRSKIRENSVAYALDFVRRMIIEQYR